VFLGEPLGPGLVVGLCCIVVAGMLVLPGADGRCDTKTAV